jgi:hypothetical protein
MASSAPLRQRMRVRLSSGVRRKNEREMLPGHGMPLPLELHMQLSSSAVVLITGRNGRHAGFRCPDREENREENQAEEAAIAYQRHLAALEGLVYHLGDSRDCLPYRGIPSLNETKERRRIRCPGRLRQWQSGWSQEPAGPGSSPGSPTHSPLAQLAVAPGSDPGGSWSESTGGSGRNEDD